MIPSRCPGGAAGREWRGQPEDTETYYLKLFKVIRVRGVVKARAHSNTAGKVDLLLTE